jgi:hypothetical protein
VGFFVYIIVQHLNITTMNLLSKLFPTKENETPEARRQRYKLKFFIWLSVCFGLWAVFNQISLWTTRAQLNTAIVDGNNALSTIEFFKKKIQKDSSTKYLQEVQIGDERSAKLHAQADADKFKKLYLSVKGKVSVEIKDVAVPINSTPDQITQLPDSVVPDQCDSLLQQVYKQCDSLLAEQIALGSTFNKDSKWFYTGGRIFKDSLQIDSIGFHPGRISFIYGQVGGFLKKKRDNSQITFENPHMKLTDMSSLAVIDLRPKPKRVIWMIAGVIVGGVTTYLLVK